MSGIVRLVRVQDRLGPAPTWAINPTTNLLETVAPLTWTGVRPYTIGDATLRVLRRREQIASEGHKKRLRRLSATRGHPSGDRDVEPANARELVVGWTGDVINDEIIDGYYVPTSSCSVFDPETIALITDAASPRSQTSLGYNALWWAPQQDEIVSEGPEGPVGEWLGPNGPERYDVEHIVDPDCEIVLRLARNNGFDPRRLGPNHFAIALERGRGGVQSELLRVVDSLDLPIGSNPVTVQVPKMPSPKTPPIRDATWTVGTSRDLPLVDGPDWDGAKAEASVFAWAGFDSDSPDPAKAKQAFLVYDTSAPELKGSYKLPIARYENGRLEVLASGLSAAASYLPQTDIPADVEKRARGVLDLYYAKLEEMRSQGKARDALAHVSMHLPVRKPRTSNMPENIVEQITLGIGRDNEAALRKRGIAVPQAHVVHVRDMDAEKIRAAVEGMQEMLGKVLVMLSEGEEKMADMESQEELNESMGTELSDLKKRVMEMEDACKKMSDALGLGADVKLGAVADALSSMKVQRDALLVEVEPLRADALARARDIAGKVGVAKDELDKAADIAAVRRLAAVKVYGEVKFGKANDDAIAGAFVGIEASVAQETPATTTTTAPSNLANVPTPSLPTVRDAANPDPKTPAAAPTSTSASIRGGLKALG